MQLPYGTLASSHRGSADLKLLGEAFEKEGLNGYLRVSVFDRSAVRECVIVYRTGKPVMSFTSEGAADRADPGFRHAGEAIGREDAIVEICQLQEKQVRLLQDLYRDLAVVVQAAPAVVIPPKPAPAPREPLREPPRAPAAPRTAENGRPMPMPEIRGRFVRAEEAGDVDEYVRRHPGETGHLLYIAPVDGRQEELHVIIIKGKIAIAYDDRAAGPELPGKLKGVPGHAEFYAVEESLLQSIASRYTRPGSPRAPEKEKGAPAIGIQARDLLESARPAAAAAPVREEVVWAVAESHGSFDDDVALVRKVEREFAGHVDELLSKLELSHLRTRKRL
ncbi:MAG TPA: hypothetical protein VLT35_00610 [Methanocella sp.]|nr:hypothetical protein [Methanocella sp.]